MLELIVVLVIAGILSLISAATYSLFSETFANREARTNIDRIVLAERGWVTRNSSWTGNASDLLVGRGLSVTNGISTGSTIVSISVEGGVRLGVAAMSDSGTCQAKVLSDPLINGSETWVTLDGDMPCSGQAALVIGI